MTTKSTRLKLVPKSPTKAAPIEAPDDVCKDCRAAEALAKHPMLAPPRGSFLHYLVTLPRLPSHDEDWDDEVTRLASMARIDEHLHEVCAKQLDWGPHLLRHVVAPVEDLQAFHRAVAEWLNDLKPITLGELRGRVHAMLNELARAYTIDPKGDSNSARALLRQVAVGLDRAETVIPTVESEGFDTFHDLLEIVRTIRYALEDGPESYGAYEANIQKALKATAAKQAGRA